MLEKHWFPLLLVHAFLLQALVILLRIGAIYQAVAIDLGTLWIGIVGGAFGILPAAFGLHLGRYIDRHGEASALIWSSVVMLLSSLCLALVGPTLVTLLVGSTVMGAGQFLGIAAQQSAAGKSDSSGRAQNFGTLTLAIAAAQAVGPLGISVFAGDRLLPDTQSIFWAGCGISAVSVACALIIRLPRHVQSMQKQSLLQTAKMLIGTVGYQMATYASLVIFSAMDLLLIYLPLYGSEHAIGASTVGVLLAVRAVASILSRLFFGRMLDIVGRNRLLLLSLSLSGLAIGVLTLTTEPILMGVLLFFAGLALGLGAPLTLAWLADIVPTHMRGSAFSLRLAVNRVGQAVIPIAAGFIVGPLGLTGVLLAVSVSLLLSAAISGKKLARRR